MAAGKPAPNPASASLQITKARLPLLQSIGPTYRQYQAMLVLWERDGLTLGDISARLLLHKKTRVTLG